MLDVVGRVEIEFGGSQGRLAADGRRVDLDVDDPSVLIGVLDLRSLRALAASLAVVGLTLQVRSGERLLLMAGRDAETGILSRLLRLPGLRLDPRFALRSALGRGLPRP